MAHQYGVLDELGILMYAPETATFKAFARTIDPCNGMIGMKDQPSRNVSHPGGAVFFLREDSRKTFNCYPINFIAPSFVTISKEDLAEMKIDIETPRSHKSANWPGMSQIEKCLNCRKQNVVDGKTEHILCLQPAIMKAFPERQSIMAGTMLWRIFCVPCFTKISGSMFLNVLEDGKVVERSIPSMQLIREGYGAPFEPSGQTTVPAYKRSSTTTFTGLHMAISSDFQKYTSNIMGAKTKVDVNVAPGASQKMVSVIKKKVTEGCANCGKSAVEAAMDASETGELTGDERTKALMGCSKCKKVRYCSRSCQVSHWKSEHKLVCATLAEK